MKTVIGVGIAVPLGKVNKESELDPTQIITDAMLTEEEDFYMASENETNVYLQLEEI